MMRHEILARPVTLGMFLVALATLTGLPGLKSSVHAQSLRGYGTGALQGGDLTDPENNGAADANTGYNAIFFGNNEPFFGGGEGAFNVFDNRVGGGNDKWCCDNPGSFHVGADFSGKQFVLTRFNFASDNDSGTSRDPDIWSIQGSNDGSSWTTIYSYNNDGTSPFTLGGGSVENKVLQYDAGSAFATPAPYSMFRYLVTSGVAGAHAISEIEFFGVTQPELTPNPGNGSTIDLGAVDMSTSATTQLTLSNTGTTNLSEIDLLSYSITGADASLFELTGFNPTAVGAHGTSAAGDGLLSDGAGNALNTEIYDITFLGSTELGTYSALLQIFAQDDNGTALTLAFPLQATVTPEPASILLWALVGLAACGWGWRWARRR